MGSQWTDKSAIMRDLSFAQGRWVPGAIDTAVASGKPPTHNITEETEEEYFKRWTADGDYSACPDLSLISKMLEMVHDEEPESQQETQTGPIEIKKLNPVAKIFVPKFKKTAIKETHQNIEVKPIPKKTDKKKKPLHERNVAIASIIANSCTSPPSQDLREASIKLSRPEDFIKTSAIRTKIEKEEVMEISRRKDSVNKVNSWLQTQDMRVMFKRKSTESVKSPVQSDLSVKSPPNPGQQYVPSSWAGEYYKKCIERTHIRDMVEETVWARAEKLMKDIDLRKAEEQRKQEEEDAALAAAMAAAERGSPSNEVTDHRNSEEKSDERDDSPGGDLHGLASVLLPKHRHQLTGDCIVCKVLTEPPADKETLFETKPEPVALKPEVQDADGDQEDFFCLVRSNIVGNLADIESGEQNLIPLQESGSSEELYISTSDS